MNRDANTQHRRLRTILEGAGQGFGLRPTVYRVVQRLRLKGFVRNVDAGVEIEIEGGSQQIDSFLCQFKVDRPATAVVTTEEIQRVTSLGSLWFEILPDIKRAPPSGFETKNAQTRAADLLKIAG